MENTVANISRPPSPHKTESLPQSAQERALGNVAGVGSSARQFAEGKMVFAAKVNALPPQELESVFRDLPLEALLSKGLAYQQDANIIYREFTRTFAQRAERDPEGVRQLWSCNIPECNQQVIQCFIDAGIVEKFVNTYFEDDGYGYHDPAHGNTAISMAVKRGNVDALDKLLGCKEINVNAVDEDGKSALDYARKAGMQEVVARLLSSTT